MIQTNEITEIGKFQKTHALKGELNAILDVEPQFVQDGNALIVELDGIYVPFYGESIRPKGNTSFLIKLAGIDSEEDAKKFVNKGIFAVKSQLAPFLDMDEAELFDDSELIGYTIFDSGKNIPVGTVTDIDDSTNNLLFVVETPDGDEILIPAADELIKDIDDGNKTIGMILPEGLIDING